MSSSALQMGHDFLGGVNSFQIPPHLTASCPFNPWTAQVTQPQEAGRGIVGRDMGAEASAEFVCDDLLPNYQTEELQKICLSSSCCMKGEIRPRIVDKWPEPPINHWLKTNA